MFVEIVMYEGSPIDRDELEEALEEAFAADGEVTGAGIGVDSANVDLEIDPATDRDEALARVRRVIADLGIEDVTRVIPRD